jgi:hypothetical protein
MKAFECSAKDNTNVIEPFKYLAGEYIKKYKDRIQQFGEVIERSS